MKIRMDFEPVGDDRERVRLTDTSDPANPRSVGKIDPATLGEHFRPVDITYSIQTLEEIIRIMKMTLEERHDEKKKQDERERRFSTPNN